MMRSVPHIEHDRKGAWCAARKTFSNVQAVQVKAARLASATESDGPGAEAGGGACEGGANADAETSFPVSAPAPATESAIARMSSASSSPSAMSSPGTADDAGAPPEPSSGTEADMEDANFPSAVPDVFLASASIAISAEADGACNSTAKAG
jgi:hypothetical protein